MNIKKWWGKLEYWKKGGIIGLIVGYSPWILIRINGVLGYILVMLIYSPFMLIWQVTPESGKFPINYLLLPLIYPIIGLIIGFIIDKRK